MIDFQQFSLFRLSRLWSFFKKEKHSVHTLSYFYDQQAGHLLYLNITKVIIITTN